MRVRVGVKVSIKELIFHEGIAILLLVQFIHFIKCIVYCILYIEREGIELYLVSFFILLNFSNIIETDFQT